MRVRTLPGSRLTVPLIVAASLLCCAASGLSATDVLCLAPALVLAGSLLARRYPGERVLLAFAVRRRARRVRTPVLARPKARAGHGVPRGGLLMAFALAVRPPPALPAS